MKIKPEQLARTLTSSNLPLYWLAGDEPLLMQESADQIRQHYSELGYAEREIFHAEKGFNWEHFANATNNLSLFSQHKIIELRLSSAKLEATGKQAIQQYLADPNPEYLILISSPKLEAATINSNWFKQIEGSAVLVQIWPVNREDLSSWLERRLRREGIHADEDALILLSDKVEGNLLAAMQEIEKLKLLANNSEGASIHLDANTVMQVVADSSRYNVYHLVDAALLGEPSRSQKILNCLYHEGIYPLVVLGAITRELRALLPMLEKKQQGQGINAIVQSARVWFNRKQAVTHVLQRIGTDEIWQLLDHARLIDQSIKGMSRANPWDELSLLLLRLSGAETASMNLSA